MARPRVTRAIRQRVEAAAGGRCGYCLTPQAFTAMPLHIEHILPLAAGGTSDESNLWVACPLCNGYKGTQTGATDPETREVAPLYDPRRQDWTEHFYWSADGSLVLGSTPTGRASVVALKLNNPHLVRARLRWVAAGWHPPRAS